MATSKTGGSRAYLRGRVGSDVYSIGKDAKGKKQQVVRSLAESVKNPQTQAQMFGRMIMSTVMQAVSAMRPIIDHSFDNVPTGQPNVSEFIKRNYNLIAADAKTNATTGNSFGLNEYQEKGIKQGAYVISAGSAIGIKGVAVDGTAKTITIALESGATMGDLKDALGLTSNDYFTACAILASGSFIYERFHISDQIADATAIAAGNVEDLFLIEGNTTAVVSLSGTNVVITLGDFSANYGIIVSRKVESGFQHSACTLVAPSAPAYTAEVALATYPVGEQKFLNGGGEESGSDPFVPEPFATSMVSAEWGGQNWAKGSQVAGSSTQQMFVKVVVSNFDATHEIKFGSLQQNKFVTLESATYDGPFPNFPMIPGGYITDMALYVDGVMAENWGTCNVDNHQDENTPIDDD